MLARPVALLHRRPATTAAASAAPTSTSCWTRWTATTWAGRRRWRRSSWAIPDRPELGEELTNSFCRTDPAIARAFARTTFLSDNRADLARVAVPTLVLQCASDAIAPPEVGAYVRARIPGSQLVTLPATGHCPQLSAPEATLAAIASFAGGPAR